MTSVEYTDGGRTAAGFRGDAGDCVARAIAIASGLPYREVYTALAAGQAAAGGRRSARDGVPRKVYGPYLAELGFEWFPTMEIGSGCRVHLRASELPGGALVVRLSHHLVAVVDGVVHDTHDPSRDGTRCVYGYWSRRDDWPVHQPAAPEAPIPGRHWYSGCEPGGDWDSELGRYTGTGPRVRPDGVCEGCGARACRVCGRDGCPDHPIPGS